MKPNVLLLVLAGGAGGRLETLTDHRAKPVVPYAGHYRLIDVPLSNALHAGLQHVWVIEAYNPASLSDHLANGRPWDLDRTTGGLLVLHPHQGGDKEGWHEGTADAVWRQAGLIRDLAPDALVVVSADAVYRLDYDALVTEHLDSGAAVTMVTTEVDPDDASRYGVVQVEDGRVVDYAYKPDDPASNLVTNEVFVFDPERVLALLDELADDAGDSGLEDLGDSLLPRLVDEGAAREHRLDGYWRDLGTIDAYWAAHQDLVRQDPPFRPDDQQWPLLTVPQRSGPARVLAGATVSDSLLSPGVVVGGTVERSVLSPRVVVEAGATVVDSVLLDDVVVRSGATVRRAVVDAEADVAADVGGEGDVALVGKGQRVTSPLPAGGRLPEPEDD